MPPKSRKSLPGAVSIALTGMGLLTGCAHPTISDQAQLSRPGMTYSDSPALADSGSLLSRLEPGTDNRGGASASGCTACQ